MCKQAGGKPFIPSAEYADKLSRVRLREGVENVDQASRSLRPLNESVGESGPVRIQIHAPESAQTFHDGGQAHYALKSTMSKAQHQRHVHLRKTRIASACQNKLLKRGLVD